MLISLTHRPFAIRFAVMVGFAGIVSCSQKHSPSADAPAGPGMFLGRDVPVVTTGGLELRWWEMSVRADRKLNARAPIRRWMPQNSIEAEHLGWWMLYVRGQVREPYDTAPFFVEQRAEVGVMTDENGRDLLPSAVPMPLVSMRMPGQPRYPLPLPPKRAGIPRYAEEVKIGYWLPELPRRFSELSGLVHATNIRAWVTPEFEIAPMTEAEEGFKKFYFRIKSVLPQDIDKGVIERRMRFEYRIERPDLDKPEKERTGMPFVAAFELLDAKGQPLGALDVTSDSEPVVEADGALVLRDGYIDLRKPSAAKLRVYLVTVVEKVEIPFDFRDLPCAGGGVPTP